MKTALVVINYNSHIIVPVVHTHSVRACVTQCAVSFTTSVLLL